jgi:hypothetical protein
VRSGAQFLGAHAHPDLIAPQPARVVRTVQLEIPHAQAACLAAGIERGDLRAEQIRDPQQPRHVHVHRLI